MPQFVTHLFHSRRAAAATVARGSFAGEAAHASRALRRRLATLRTPAPDTLRARIRRELRAAVTTTTTRSE
jgi:hypothetical protein